MSLSIDCYTLGDGDSVSTKSVFVFVILIKSNVSRSISLSNVFLKLLECSNISLTDYFFIACSFDYLIFIACRQFHLTSIFTGNHCTAHITSTDAGRTEYKNGQHQHEHYFIIFHFSQNSEKYYVKNVFII